MAKAQTETDEPQEPKMQALHVFVPVEDHETLRTLAFQRRVKIAELVRVAIREFLAKPENKPA